MKRTGVTVCVSASSTVNMMDGGRKLSSVLNRLSRYASLCLPFGAAGSNLASALCFFKFQIGAHPTTDGEATPQLDPDTEQMLHGGILRCLQNSGHLETALHRGIGVLSQRPDLAPAVTPYAVEAAWRLGRWEALDDLLTTDGSIGPGSSRKAPAVSSVLHDYNTMLGSVILNLVSSPDGSSATFREALDEARLNVMTGLAAASMESYHR